MELEEKKEEQVFTSGMFEELEKLNAESSVNWENLHRRRRLHKTPKNKRRRGRKHQRPTTIPATVSSKASIFATRAQREMSRKMAEEDRSLSEALLAERRDQGGSVQLKDVRKTKKVESKSRQGRAEVKGSQEWMIPFSYSFGSTKSK